MNVRNISNQGVILKRTDDKGTMIDSVRVQPGDHDIHESWREAVNAHALLVVTDASTPAYEGPSSRKIVEAPPSTNLGAPSSPVKHDDAPAGSAPHPGRPDLNPDAEPKRDDKGPGTRRRDG